MPTPSTAKVIKIKVTSGVKGQPLVVRNRSTGEELRLTLGATAQAVVDLNNFASGYTAGQVVEFTISGERLGQTTLTPAGSDSETVTLGTSAITSGLSRGI